MHNPLPKVRVDAAAHRAWLGDWELRLTPLQFSLLALFVSRAGRAITHEELMSLVWGSTHGNDKTMRMHLSHLRRKLGDDAARPRYITTVHSVGYRFEADMCEQAAPPAEPEPTRVVLVKPGDVLVFGNVGEQRHVACAATALRDQLGLREVLLFAGDVDMTAVPGGALDG